MPHARLQPCPRHDFRRHVLLAPVVPLGLAHSEDEQAVWQFQVQLEAVVLWLVRRGFVDYAALGFLPLLSLGGRRLLVRQPQPKFNAESFTVLGSLLRGHPRVIHPLEPIVAVVNSVRGTYTGTRRLLRESASRRKRSCELTIAHKCEPSLRVRAREARQNQRRRQQHLYSHRFRPTHHMCEPQWLPLHVHALSKMYEVTLDVCLTTASPTSTSKTQTKRQRLISGVVSGVVADEHSYFCTDHDFCEPCCAPPPPPAARANGLRCPVRV